MKHNVFSNLVTAIGLGLPLIKHISETKLTPNIIPGVEFKELKTYSDNRGFFRELVRYNDSFFMDSFAQWSHSKMAKNTVKAWHFHHIQLDWWYVPIGLVHVVLCDFREESETYKRKIEFKLGEQEIDQEVLSVIVRIPQGVLHGCQVLSEFAHLFYITSESYNPDDEGRYPFNSPLVPHSWGDSEGLIVAENDRKLFMPKAKRTKV